MSDQQLNKVFGRITMFQHGGPSALPTDRYPDFDEHSGTPNQKSERTAILVRRYSGLDPAHPIPDLASLSRAITEALALLRYQRVHGHQKLAQANEFHSPSHDPIWIRGEASLLISAYALSASPPASSPLPLIHLISDLLEECNFWWACFYTRCAATAVHNGPRSGEVISAGARFVLSNCQVRDVAFGLLDGQTAEHVAGRNFWRNALQFQDTFGAELVRRFVVAYGRVALARNLANDLPTAGDFVVTYCGDGHQTTATSLQAGDPEQVWVRYSDGELGTGAAATGALGPIGHTARVGRVCAAQN